MSVRCGSFRRGLAQMIVHDFGLDGWTRWESRDAHEMRRRGARAG